MSSVIGPGKRNAPFWRPPSGSSSFDPASRMRFHEVKERAHRVFANVRVRVDQHHVLGGVVTFDEGTNPGVVANTVSAVVPERHERAPIPTVGLDCLSNDVDRPILGVVVGHDHVHRPDLFDLVFQRLETVNHQLGRPVVENDDEDLHAPCIIDNESTFGKSSAPDSRRPRHEVLLSERQRRLPGAVFGPARRHD